ncbi:nucleotide exchange factor GrpE [Kitasatospora sp. NPDC094015]|uniref:nucleotide exchange factor GrpE n=1 Tax=Kitasatospora sp. NPDC094015 TaxID=3155205 RepID=UPI003326523D
MLEQEWGEPLEVPQRALEVDLAQSFSQLLFRASLLQRLRGEEARAATAAQRDLLGLLVEVDDALAALGLDQELVLLGRGSGIEATRRRLLGKLAKAGVRPMRLEGLAADPALSEIVGSEVRPGLEPETVVQTVVTGFFWNDEVLRRAQVVVAAPPPAPGEPAEPVAQVPAQRPAEVATEVPQAPVADLPAAREPVGDLPVGSVPVGDLPVGDGPAGAGRAGAAGPRKGGAAAGGRRRRRKR